MNTNSTCVARVGENISSLPMNPDGYCILYVNKAALTMRMQQKCYRAVAGQVAIIAPVDKDIQISPDGGFEGFLLQVNDPVAGELVRRYTLFMNASESAIHIISTGAQQRRIRTVFQNITAEIASEPESSETIVHLMLQELMVRLYRAELKTQKGAASNRAEVVTAVCTFLEKEYNHPLNLETIASRYNMSVSYLSHIFKEFMGVSLMRYLLLTRIRVAREYLTQTALPINEIAEKCGFNDLSNFGRTFRKETGLSPRHYRQNHRTGK